MNKLQVCFNRLVSLRYCDVTLAAAVKLFYAERNGEHHNNGHGVSFCRSSSATDETSMKMIASFLREFPYPQQILQCGFGLPDQTVEDSTNSEEIMTTTHQRTAEEKASKEEPLHPGEQPQLYVHSIDDAVILTRMLRNICDGMNEVEGLFSKEDLVLQVNDCLCQYFYFHSFDEIDISTNALIIGYLQSVTEALFNMDCIFQSCSSSSSRGSVPLERQCTFYARYCLLHLLSTMDGQNVLHSKTAKANFQEISHFFQKLRQIYVKTPCGNVHEGEVSQDENSKRSSFSDLELMQAILSMENLLQIVQGSGAEPSSLSDRNDRHLLVYPIRAVHRYQQQ